MPDFKAKKAPDSISAGALPQTPLEELTALLHTPSWCWSHLHSRPSGPRNNLPPQICIPKSAYDKADDESVRKDQINYLSRDVFQYGDVLCICFFGSGR